MSYKPMTKGAHHIGLTVPDLPRARAFFVDALGFDEVGGVPDYPAVFVSDGGTMITLWQASDPAKSVPFDRRNVIGLHHFALRIEDGAALEELHLRLGTTDGVEIEFAPEPLGGGPATHMMCAIPGGIRVEFIAPAG